MKKTFIAIGLLALLTTLSAWNLQHLRILTGELSRGVEEARACCQKGDFEAAGAVLDKSLELWLGSDGYTHIFIRHSEIDAASDIFYDLRGDILAEDGEAAEANGEKLLYHLQSIYAMERLSFKSIF